MAQKPSIPKGTRDFSPLEMARRNYIFDTIKSVFSLYGFQQIETPAMENLSTLMGKYGEEGDKLLFKILNSGDWKSSISHEALDTATIGALTTKVSEKGLRYDLTVPFARFVVQHRDEIQFPFKRYQIQPVWRADRPQKGRYREFYQCDVDVVGTNSLLSEVELIQIVAEVYRRLGIRVCLHINNRKILAGIAEVIGQPERIIDITVAIDKLDKIGIDNVNKELLEKGIPAEAVEALQPILNLNGTNSEKLDQLAEVLTNSETGLQGIEELRTIFALYAHSTQDGDLSTYEPVSLQVELDLCLARGLNYYTGAIFEVKALDAQIGSITGGGRYDNLTGIFGMPGVSGVGISFGADRIYDVLCELNLYPENLQSTTQLLFATFGQEELLYAVRWAGALREKGYSVEVYPEPTKMKKQMGYADAKKIPYVAIVGGDEMAAGKVMLKNMTSGEQQLVSLEQLLAQL
ncbi:MAG: histidine--tRNA ligase [Paludibacteraceae bacterium]|nr:histidine--tRNA ligase [Paludibacteraceae bacterium]